MKKLSIWGGVGKNTSDNPYMKELMRDLVNNLYDKLLALENYYNQIVYDNKLNGMIVPEEHVESFQEIFNKDYPFDLSFDDLVFDFAKLKDSVIRNLSKMQ